MESPKASDFLEGESSEETSLIYRYDSTLRVVDRGRAGLLYLLEAWESARELRHGLWDFALEIGRLKELGLAENELRWLVCQGVLEHAREITPVGRESRSFHRDHSLKLYRKTCFVLTDAGVRFVRETLVRPRGVEDSDRIVSGRENGQFDLLVPFWDRERQELRLGDVIVKQFKVPAPNQQMVLTVFQEEDWPVRIDDPLPPHPEVDPKRRLHDTINSLNRNQKSPLIRFLGDGSGQGIRWKTVVLAEEHEPDADPPTVCRRRARE